MASVEPASSIGKATTQVQEKHVDTEKGRPSESHSAEFIQLPEEEWPSKPAPLASDPVDKVLMTIYDLALIIAPIFLIIKAGLCFLSQHLENQDANHGNHTTAGRPLTQFLIRFNQQLTTVFTILFVMIVSTLLRRYALFRAQRGAYVRTLEQYQASVSLPSTVKTILSLRAWTFTSLGLVLLWCFYYLGSQASIREYAKRPSPPFVRTTLFTPDFFTGSIFSRTYDNSDLVDINTDFAVSYYSRAQRYNDKTDYQTDGNFRAVVPFVDESGRQSRDKHGWLQIKKVDELQSTSYTGIPVFRLPKDNGLIVGTFDTPASYFVTHCEAFKWLSGLSLNSSRSTLRIEPRQELSANKSVLLDLYSQGPGGVSHTVCDLAMVTLDLQVQCGNDARCAVKKYLPRIVNEDLGPASNALDLSLPNKYVNYSTPFSNTTLLQLFLDNLMNATLSPTNVGTSSQLEYILYQALSNERLASGYVNLTRSLPPDSDAIRQLGSFNISDPEAYFNSEFTSFCLSGLLNSYYYSSMSTFSKVLEDDVLASSTGPGQAPRSHYAYSAVLDGNIYFPQFKVEIPWVVLDIVSCVILLVAAIFSFILRLRTLAPDIFGYVSSVTRDNPNLPLPVGGTTLSGFARARAMKGVKIRIGDIGDESVGRVGVTLAKGRDVYTKSELTERRMYL